MRCSSKLALATLGVVMVGLAGCSESDEGGFGLPTLGPDAQQRILDASGRSPEVIDGTLRIESDGCMTFDDSRPGDERAWIVWPDTARQDGDTVVLDSGARLGQGARIDGAGAYIEFSELPDAAESSSYFASFGGFCGAVERGVLLITEIAS